MSSVNPRLEDIDHRVNEAIHKHWILFMIQGLVVTILGVLAVVEPMIATFAVVIFAGWLFLIGGFFGLAGVITARHMPGFWWSLISAVLAIIFGLYLIWRPFAGMLSLTLAIAVLFAAQGIVQIMNALEHRRVLTSWGWFVMSGLVDILLAAIILSSWPGTAAWTLGLLFGINLIMWGISWIMTALACRTVPPRLAKAAT
jgi:uncharacterized membrane protein HdeD (DUF308 family)